MDNGADVLLHFSAFLLLGPVDKEDSLGGACDGCIEPSEVVGGEKFLCHVTLINEDVGPLTALCLVASDCVGVLDL